MFSKSHMWTATQIKKKEIILERRLERSGSTVQSWGQVWNNYCDTTRIWFCLCLRELCSTCESHHAIVSQLVL